MQNPSQVSTTEAACISSTAIRYVNLWNDTSDDVARIDESDLQKIIKTIGEHGFPTYLPEPGEILVVHQLGKRKWEWEIG